jgi:hypothetical protein
LATDGSADALVRQPWTSWCAGSPGTCIRADVGLDPSWRIWSRPGLFALIEAARSYEDRGHAFSTYASMRVRGAMIDQLRRDARVSRSVDGRAQKPSSPMARARLEQRQHAAAPSVQYR